MADPYHSGELEAQRRAGSRDEADQTGSMIRDRLPAGAVPWLATQPFVVVATADEAGWPWASPWWGEPGFAIAPANDRVLFDLDRTQRSDGDAALARFERDPRVALLVIDLATRRRLRVAGTASRKGGSLEVSVQQAFPNCPKYIHRREVVPAPAAATAAVEEDGGGDAALDARVIAALGAADTFFLATRGADGRLDVSHRGGTPGFVVRRDDGALVVPDHAGNGMFNSFGNLLTDPRAGLAFLDFATGATLQLRANAEPQFDPGRADVMGERRLLVHVEGWKRWHGARRSWTLVERPPE